MLEIIPDSKEIDDYVKLADDNSFAFEYNDFFRPNILDNRDEIDRLVNLYLSLGRNTCNDTFHGAFYDVIYFSSDMKIREVAVSRMVQSVETAERLSCKGIVFHTNFNPAFLRNNEYEKQWIESTVSVVKSLVRESSNVDIYFENMFDTSPEQLRKVADCLSDEKRFGICLDIAHMMLGETEIEIWFEKLHPFIKHFHFNDCYLKYDEHLPVGSGKIDWNGVFSLIDKYSLSNTSQLLEVNGREAINKSYEFIRQLNKR